MNINGTEVEATRCTPVFAVDAEGKIRSWNQAAVHCFGYQRSEVLGRRCWKVLAGRELPSNRFCDEICEVRKMAFLGKPIRDTQMFFLNDSGETVAVSMSTLAVRGEKGKEIAHLLRCL